MNFTSLKPHLAGGASSKPHLAGGKIAAPVMPPAPPVNPAFLELTNSVFAQIQQFVLCGGSAAALQERLQSVVSLLQADSAAELTGEAASGIARRTADILKEYREICDQDQRDRQEALTSIFALLKEALLAVSTRGDRVIESFSKMETSLKRASEAGDIKDLRAQVGNILQFVQKEGARERKESERAISSLSQRYTAAQGTPSLGGSRLPDRTSALDAVQNYSGSEHLFAILICADQSESIRGRYGDSALNELMQELAGLHEKIMTTRASPFRWSADSVLLLAESYRDLTGFRQDVLKALETDFEFKLFLGLRLATLNVQLRFAVFAAMQPDFASTASRFLEKP